jgi:hypothetical protein
MTFFILSLSAAVIWHGQNNNNNNNNNIIIIIIIIICFVVLKILEVTKNLFVLARNCTLVSKIGQTVIKQIKPKYDVTIFFWGGGELGQMLKVYLSFLKVQKLCH